VLAREEREWTARDIHVSFLAIDDSQVTGILISLPESAVVSELFESGTNFD
jgi:hypothetical protein